MKSMNLSRTATAVAMAALVATQAFAADGNRRVETQQSKSAVAAVQQAQPAVKRVIVVSLVDRKLALMEDGKVVKIYRVAVGKTSTPSPTGTYTIAVRVQNPTYYHHGKVIQPGPANPVGNRWMGLNVRGYGIHGTNVPSSIGKAVSHGCIRLGKADIDDLFSRVRVGDSVEIVNARDTETAQIFGGALKPPVAQAAPQTAKVEPATVSPSPSIPPASDALLNPLSQTGLASAATSSLIGAL